MDGGPMRIVLLMKKRITLDLTKNNESAAVFRSLASPVRLKILQRLIIKSANVSELAEEFRIPLSSAANHIQVLEEAGLIFTEEKPGQRGAQKICAILAEDVYMNIMNSKREKTVNRSINYSMPLGNYFECSVTKPCGIAGEHQFIGIEDMANSFYSPDRTHAQIIWFTTGFLEYRFPNYAMKPGGIQEIVFSFEACSEAPGYNQDWPSDISVWINNQEVFVFRSSGDFGDKRGILNPAWWPGESTQYGELHRLEINAQGCFGDARKTSALNLDSLGIRKGKYVSFKIGVKSDAECAGGINLFGEHFGNYRQNIEMAIIFEERNGVR
jgi:predicted transcriptional regulator